MLKLHESDFMTSEKVQRRHAPTDNNRLPEIYQHQLSKLIAGNIMKPKKHYSEYSSRHSDDELSHGGEQGEEEMSRA